MSDPLAQGQAVLAHQPFSAWLGARLTAFAPGRADLELDIRPEFAQQFGYVHGGVISYLADNALTFAGGSALGPNVLTSGFTITYLAPGQGERLIARATVAGASGRQAVCRCEVVAVQAGRETPIAFAQGTIVQRGDRVSGS